MIQQSFTKLGCLLQAAHVGRSVDNRLCSEADVRVKCVNGRNG